jgi:hypothetical protein
MEQLGSHWTDFHEIWYFNIFQKFAKKIQVSLKSDTHNGTLHEDLCTFMIISRWILLIMRNDSGQTCRENQNTFHVQQFFPWKSCVLWDNVGKHGRARQATNDYIIRRIRFACRISKTKIHTHSYLIPIAFPRQQWLRERASMCYTYTACLVKSYLEDLPTSITWKSLTPTLNYTIIRHAALSHWTRTQTHHKHHKDTHARHQKFNTSAYFPLQKSQLLGTAVQSAVTPSITAYNKLLQSAIPTPRRQVH